MSVKVKICGVTSPADAVRAAEAGADAIGMMFYPPSPRAIDIVGAKAIARELPPFVLRVGVFVNPTEDEVWSAVSEVGLNLLQFHGEEPPEFCSRFGVMSMKAFRVRDEETLALLGRYPTDAWLLDAHSAKGLGGTGETFNWDLAVKARELGRPIFLAGGLTSENVAQAVRHVRPFGVDVSSGVESEPGRKDAEKVRAFIAAAKGAVDE